MIKAVSLLLFLISGNLLAQQDIALLDPFLSLKYTRGPYLIYDCKDKHWVCAGKAEFNYCQESRDFQIKERSESLGCVPVRSFNTEIDCNSSQKKLTSRAVATRFCAHPNIQGATKLEVRD